MGNGPAGLAWKRLGSNSKDDGVGTPGASGRIGESDKLVHIILKSRLDMRAARIGVHQP
jgi:hypothetical protein